LPGAPASGTFFRGAWQGCVEKAAIRKKLPEDEDPCNYNQNIDEYRLSINIGISIMMIRAIVVGRRAEYGSL